MFWQPINEVVDALVDELMAAAAGGNELGAGGGSPSAGKGSGGTELERSGAVPEGRAPQFREEYRQSSEQSHQGEGAMCITCRREAGSPTAEISYPAEAQEWDKPTHISRVDQVRALASQCAWARRPHAAADK